MAELCVIDVPDGASLEDLLFAYGVEFPCGGASLCGGCRVRVVEGNVPVTEEMRDALSDEELDSGWRLACKAQVRGRIVLEVGQWNAPILSDDTRIESGSQHGFAVAVDLGTTTIVAQLVDLRTGEIHGTRTALNPQSAHGADVMSRVEFDLRHPGVLTATIREAIRAIVADLRGRESLREVLVAGNTVMHHLFCGLSVEPLSHVPFEPSSDGQQTVDFDELGCRVTFLPCLGGFVGSDILAGIVAVGLFDTEDTVALVDLGTNGEIVIGNARGALCASTAAGPAFEAGRIRMGMRAAPGAIDRVTRRADGFHCHVIGGVEPRGICGSGLVDAVAAALDSGSVKPNGRIADGSKELQLCAPVHLSQADIRELQLAKGAVAAGFRVLQEQIGVQNSGIARAYLAGAFGNYVNIASALRIGLLETEPAKITPSGNTALRGVKMLLSAGDGRDAMVESVRRRTHHVSLGSDAAFQEQFANCMRLA